MGPIGEVRRKPSRGAKELTEDELWFQLWSSAIYDLGLAPEYFYSISPGMVLKLLDRHQQRLEREEFLAGQIAACVANFSMCRPKKPVDAQDFMPSQWRRRENLKLSKPSRMTKKRRQRVADQLRSIMAPFIRT